MYVRTDNFAMEIVVCVFLQKRFWPRNSLESCCLKQKATKQAQFDFALAPKRCQTHLSYVRTYVRAHARFAKSQYDRGWSFRFVMNGVLALGGFVRCT